MPSDGAVQSPAGDGNKISDAGFAWEQLHLMNSPHEKREILSFAPNSGCHHKGITTVHVVLHTLAGVIRADVLGQDSNSVR